MLGPYTANKDGSISFRGNKIYKPIRNINQIGFPYEELNTRVQQFCEQCMWGSIARINNRINLSANIFFNKMSALFTTLPLTTRMISSPGAVYGKEAIDYTSDTSPIKLDWFDLKRKIYLSESSQIYLELALMQQGVDHVYSIYNSFRKEKADATHLSEFHHIEYEGKIDQKTNVTIALGLIQHIVKDLLENNADDLVIFLDESKLKELSSLAHGIQRIPQITFREALDGLYESTLDERYKRFTMNNNFSPWEEIRLTEIFGSMIAVSQFPLLEVPFYHAVVDGVEHVWTESIPDEVPLISQHRNSNIISLSTTIERYELQKKSLVADNTDIIWPGYRETIGSGHRVRTTRELEEKARIFNLPREDYEPYLQTRRMPTYMETSGFGLGWERMLQGVLEMPFIWSASQFPRGHTTPRP